MLFDKIKLGLCVLVLVLAGALYWSVRSNGALRVERDTAEKALSAAQEQRKIDRKVVAAAQVEKAATARKSAQAQEAVQKAARDAEAWGSTIVPPEVQSALREALVTSE